MNNLTDIELAELRRINRRLWLVLGFLALIVIGLFLYQYFTRETPKKVVIAKEKAKEVRDTIKAGTDVIIKETENTTDIVEKAFEKAKNAKIKQYQPTPSETDSVTQYRADWLRGKIQ